MSKIAVLLTGNVRTWPFCSQKWIKNFPVYSFVYGEKYCYRECIAKEGVDYKEQYLSPFFAENFKFERISLGSSSFGFEFEEKIDPRLKEFIHIYRQYANIYFFLQQIMMEHSFDLILKTRFDHSFSSEFEEKFDSFLSSLREDEMGLELNTFRYLPLQKNEAGEFVSSYSDLNIHDLKASEKGLLDYRIHLSDWTFLGKPQHILDLCIFVLRNFHNPSNEKVLLACPHGMLEEFFRTSGLKIKYFPFGDVVRYQPSLKYQYPRIKLVISGFNANIPAQFLSFKFEYFFSFYQQTKFVTDLGTVQLVSQKKFNCLTRYSSLHREYPYFTHSTTWGYSLAIWYLWEHLVFDNEESDIVIYWRTSHTFDPLKLIEIAIQSYQSRKIYIPTWKLTEEMKQSPEYQQTFNILTELNPESDQSENKLVDLYLQKLFRGYTDFLFLGPTELMSKIKPYSMWPIHLQSNEIPYTSVGLFERCLQHIPIERFPLDYKGYDKEIFDAKIHGIDRNTQN